jgi:SOS response associated peptidase (SRAP)
MGSGHRVCRGLSPIVQRWKSLRRDVMTQLRLVQRFLRGSSFLTANVANLWIKHLPGFWPRYNIAPSQDVPVIVRNDKRNELRPMRWGLVPSWAQDAAIGHHMINIANLGVKSGSWCNAPAQRADDHDPDSTLRVDMKPSASKAAVAHRK